MWFRPAWAGLLSAAALIGVACAQADTSKSKTDEKSLRGVSVPVAIVVKTDKKVYKPDEPIKMTLVVKNNSSAAVSLPFSSGQKYDIEIRHGKGRNGAKAWQWSRGKVFAQMMSDLSLGSGKTITFTAAFNPNEKSVYKPLPLDPGDYTILVTLTTSGRAPRPSNGTFITVK